MSQNVHGLFQAFVATAESIRAESASPNRSVPTGLLDQANSILNSINNLHSIPFKLSAIPNADWSEVLRQLALILEVLGPLAESSEEAVSTLEHLSIESKPRVFIGCSVEGLPVAKIIQLQLRYSTETTVWHQGVFGLSTGTLETLVDKCRFFDYAILVLTPDDLVTKRGVPTNAPRDNVLFELGLFIGALGREHVFMVADNSAALPTDLAGIRPASFVSGPVGTELQARLGPVVTELELAMNVL